MAYHLINDRGKSKNRSGTAVYHKRLAADETVHNATPCGCCDHLHSAHPVISRLGVDGTEGYKRESKKTG